MNAILSFLATFPRLPPSLLRDESLISSTRSPLSLKTWTPTISTTSTVPPLVIRSSTTPRRPYVISYKKLGYPIYRIKAPHRNTSSFSRSKHGEQRRRGDVLFFIGKSMMMTAEPRFFSVPKHKMSSGGLHPTVSLVQYLSSWQKGDFWDFFTTALVSNVLKKGSKSLPRVEILYLATGDWRHTRNE